MKKRITLSIVAIAVVLLAINTVYAGVPSVVKDRFVLGEPVWKEMAIREDLAPDYEMCWKRFVEIMVDKGYEIGFMEKDSGYLRTNPNTGIVHLKSNWVYEVKIIGKLVVNEREMKNGKRTVEKLRIQVQGQLLRSVRGVLVESYSGYDKQVLQDLFNDLQLVFGRQ
jgi:hypothetical protein